MNSMNAAPAPQGPYNQPPAYEQAQPPIDRAAFAEFAQKFEQRVNAYLDPKITELRMQQQQGEAPIQHGDIGGVRYFSQRYEELISAGLDKEAATNQAAKEAEARYNPGTRIAELQRIKAGVLRGGDDARPFLYMVGAELAEKKLQLASFIQKGQDVKDMPRGAFPDDDRYVQYNRSVQMGKAFLASYAPQMPEGEAKDWMIDAAQEKLQQDRSTRDATTRGEAYLKARQAQEAQEELTFLNSLLDDAHIMRSWHV